VPGTVAPANVAVPEADFREGATILSLTGWKPYHSPLSLVQPLLRNFFHQTVAHYPRTAQQLRTEWIFDACLEAMGPEDGSSFLTQLLVDCGRSEEKVGEELLSPLQEYLHDLRSGPYLPLPLLCALSRFSDWERTNPEAMPEAREEEVDQLFWLYRLDRFHEMFRFHLYAHTCFAGAGNEVRVAFDRLLEHLFRQPATPAVHLEELYDLQATLKDPMSRETFSRMVFPRSRGTQLLDLRSIGSGDEKQVVVRSDVVDNRGAVYRVREPMSPAEMGQLYRMLRDSDYRQEILEQEQHLVIADEGEQVIGGLTYILQEKDVVYLRGLVVAASLKRRGIASALLEDFCTRMTARGARLIKTDFMARHFYSANGFRVDARWGGLVRQLGASGL
jgi:long-chain acyl-CoA synthetase